MNLKEIRTYCVFITSIILIACSSEKSISSEKEQILEKRKEAISILNDHGFTEKDFNFNQNSTEILKGDLEEFEEMVRNAAIIKSKIDSLNSRKIPQIDEIRALLKKAKSREDVEKIQKQYPEFFLKIEE